MPKCGGTHIGPRAGFIIKFARNEESRLFPYFFDGECLENQLTDTAGLSIDLEFPMFLDK